jgi:hypothetical protein
MDYSAIYARLMARARTRTLTCYKERHHIVPRCMGGGNEESNLAVLTGPEHALAHLLLVKIFPKNQKLVFAAKIMMANANNCRYDTTRTKQYGWLKELAAKATGDLHRGSKRTEDQKKRVSDALKGKPKTPEHVAKVSAALMGKPGTRRGATLTDDTKAKQSAAAFARVDKEENDQKMQEGRVKMTPEQRSANADKAWETKRRNGTDKMSDKARANISEASRKRAASETPEQKRERGLKSSATRRERGTDKYSDESKERMRQAQLGKKQSPETVAKRIATIARNKAAREAEHATLKKKAA